MSVFSNTRKDSAEISLTLDRALELMQLEEIPGISPDEDYYPRAEEMFRGTLTRLERERGADWIRENRKYLLSNWDYALSQV